MLELLEEDFLEISKMQGRRRLFFSFLPWADNVSENCSFYVHSHPLPYVSLPYAAICLIRCRVVFLQMQPYIVPSLLEISMSLTWRLLAEDTFLENPL